MDGPEGRPRLKGGLRERARGGTTSDAMSVASNHVRAGLAMSACAAKAALLGVLLLGACAPGPALLDERATQPYARLLEAEASLEVTEHALAVRERGGEALHVYAREVSGGHAERPVLVLLNGVFSSGRTWRFVTGPLAREHDLLIVDLPGTGRSATPEPDADPARYTPAWLAHATYAALAAWQSTQPAPRDVVLVGHSVAGTSVLRMLGHPEVRREHEAELGRVRGAVLIAAADVAEPSWSPTLIELAKLSDEEVALGDAFGILDRKVSEAISASVMEPERTALRGEADRILESLGDRDRRRASQAMLLRLRPVDEDDVPDWDAVAVSAADHGRVDVPVMLVWGRDDDALPLASGEKLAKEIPGATLSVVDRARHSVHQEEPEEVAAQIVRFVAALPPRRR